MQNEQELTPIFEAVKKYYTERIIPFHVPGHKQGKGLIEFKDYLGANLMGIDLTCTPDLDNICNPHGAILQAEELAAQLFGSDRAFFLVNGTTSGIQTMIMASCKSGDKILLPRNAHKSALGGLILSGAEPVYLESEFNPEFGISMGVKTEKIKWMLKKHPDIKAVFIVNPNYYGTTSDLKEIVSIAHASNIPVIVDEAHGAHLKFHANLPISAMEAGADMSACSSHKLIGSLTQSSILLCREGLVNPTYLKSILNLTQTTSPSYILLSSIDVARKQMALYGEKMIEMTLEKAAWLRNKLHQYPGIKVFGDEVIGKEGCFGFDITKVTINVSGLGLSGFEVEKILRLKYKIQVELSDLYNVMFLISIGDQWENIKYLADCIGDIVRNYENSTVIKLFPPMPEIPQLVASPREAFYGESKSLDLDRAIGEISAETVMAYPPGIPIICPGERITREVIDYINILKLEKADLQGTEDPDLNHIKILKSTRSIKLETALDGRQAN